MWYFVARETNNAHAKNDACFLGSEGKQTPPLRWKRTFVMDFLELEVAVSLPYLLAVIILVSHNQFVGDALC